MAEICRTGAQVLGFAPAYDIDPAVDTELPDEIVVDLLAAAREPPSNIGRHAEASQVTLGLHIVEETVHTWRCLMTAAVCPPVVVAAA